MTVLTLEALGWTRRTIVRATTNPECSDELADASNHGLAIGRVVAQARGVVQVAGATDRILAARIPGRLRHRLAAVDLPTVGDWVTLPQTEIVEVVGVEQRPSVVSVLPRTSAVTRKVAGAVTDGQVIAANVDLLIIAMAFGGDVNARRLERFAATAYESGATPLLVLTKRDLVDETFCAQTIAELQAVVPGMAIVAISARTGVGIVELSTYIEPGQTVAVIGSSGAGKSTLVNRIAGTEVFATGGLRNDGRGRHTTVHRELLVLPGGEILIDTPGLRELQLWDAESGTEATFPDIESVASECRFRDCAHDAEPGCAVQAAVKGGAVDAARFHAWRDLRSELAELERRQDAKRAAKSRGRRR